MKELILTILALFNLTVVNVNDPVEQETSKKVSLLLGGDVMLGRTVSTYALEKKDTNYPFLKIADTLKNADITFVNLENPIVENCPRHTTGFKFCAPPEMLSGLGLSGVDIVNLANNHTLNYGQRGFEETKYYLNNSGILYTGDSKLEIIEKNGVKFGFVGFEKSQQVNPKFTELEKNLISESNEKVDVLIVSMHWGVEYKDTSLPGVKGLAEEIVSLGGDVIVGHHPHWVQDNTKIQEKPVYYSLGNLVFDQMWSEKTREGLLVKLTFEGTNLVKEELIKTYMKNHAQPELVIPKIL